MMLVGLVLFVHFTHVSDMHAPVKASRAARESASVRREAQARGESRGGSSDGASSNQAQGASQQQGSQQEREQEPGQGSGRQAAQPGGEVSQVAGKAAGGTGAASGGTPAAAAAAAAVGEVERQGGQQAKEQQADPGAQQRSDKQQAQNAQRDPDAAASTGAATAAATAGAGAGAAGAAGSAAAAGVSAAADPVDDGPDYHDDGRGGLRVEADSAGASGDAAADYANREEQEDEEEVAAKGKQQQSQQGQQAQAQGNPQQQQQKQEEAAASSKAGAAGGGLAAAAAAGGAAGSEADQGPDYFDDGSAVLEGERLHGAWEERAPDYMQDEGEDGGVAKLADAEGPGQRQQQQEAKAGSAAGTASVAATGGAGAAAAAAGAQDATAAADAADPWVNTTAGCGALSAELLSRWAVNGTVLITLTNSVMFHNFGDTWLHHVRKAGITYWVLAVADNHTAHLVHSRGAHQCFLVQENEIDNTNATFKWGSHSWRLTTWQKVLVVRHVHHLGFNVINSDIDVVWLRNPLHHFLVKYPHPDYWVSMDPITTQNPIGDDGPELGVGTHHYMNTGVYFLRQTPGGRALIDKWYEIRRQMQAHGFHDQDGLYKYLNANPQHVNTTSRTTRVVDGATALAQLPASLFQNGYSHCINQIHKVHGLEPFEVHFVWVWGGNIGKISRMREQRYYIDPPSYYEEPYFVSYDVLPIEDPAGYNDWNDTEAMVMTHLNALESQLTDSWHGFALAALLNRTVILPKMKCYCIQNWFENPLCRLPGEPLTRFPLSPACPADFVFNMEALDAWAPLGSHLAFREFSFLDNERTPDAVKNRPLVVTAKPGIASASRDGDTLTIPAGLSSDQLSAALAPHLGTQPQPGTAASSSPPKRVHFTNPRLAFAGWSDPRVATQYEASLGGLAVRWCCRPEKVAQAAGKELHHQLVLRRAEQP